MFIPNLSKLMHCHRLLIGPKSLEASRLQETEMNLMEGFSNGFVKVSGLFLFFLHVKILASCCKELFVFWSSLPSLRQHEFSTSEVSH